MSQMNHPNPNEIQKELEELVRKRFGGNVQIFSNLGSEQPEQQADGTDETPVEPEKGFDLDFDLKPKDVKAYLDQFIIRQDEAKKALAIAVCDHYNHVRDSLKAARAQEAQPYEYSKQNVLILGPTGVGKTYMIRKIADLIGVPFVKADATRFSETGYVGANVDDLVKDLLMQADGDLEKAQYGIIYLDEADKLATPAKASGRDVNGRGVQFGLLKLMEETDVDLQSGNDIQSQMQAFMDFQRKGKVEKKIINTRHILFIVSGAFTSLEEIISKRLNTNGIGFDARKDRPKASDGLYHHATTEDFIEFGFEPEFIGRLPVRVHCQHLGTADLTEILKSSKGSILRQYERAFKAYDIDLSFTDEAIWQIAEQAAAQKTGARALMTVCEQSLREFKYELPSSDVERLVVTKEVIEDPRAELTKVLSQPSKKRLAAGKNAVKQAQADFFKTHGIAITFNKEASDAIAERALKEQRSALALCQEMLVNYEYGLSLVQQNTGQTQFSFGPGMVESPRSYLEELIRRSYIAKHRPDPPE